MLLLALAGLGTLACAGGTPSTATAPSSGMAAVSPDKLKG
jgi:hypothetical protein